MNFGLFDTPSHISMLKIGSKWPYFCEKMSFIAVDTGEVAPELGHRDNLRYKVIFLQFLMTQLLIKLCRVSKCINKYYHLYYLI